MFELIFGVFFLLMVAEVVLFLFLNLPVPKRWKSVIFKAVATSPSLKTFLKVQLLLCVLAGLFYYEMSVEEGVFTRQKNKLKSKTSFGAGRHVVMQVRQWLLRAEEVDALLPDPQDSAQQVYQLPRGLHFCHHRRLLHHQAAPLRARGEVQGPARRPRTPPARTRHRQRLITRQTTSQSGCQLTQGRSGVIKLYVVAAGRTVCVSVQPVLEAPLVELVPAGHVVHAPASLHLTQADGTLLGRPQHAFPEHAEVPLQSTGDLKALQLRVVPAVGLDELQSGGSGPELGLRLHHQLAHAVEELDSEVAKPTNERVVGVCAHEQVGAVYTLQFLYLPLQCLLVREACELHGEQHINLLIHHRFTHLHMCQRVRKCHYAPHLLLAFHLFLELYASFLLLLASLATGVHLLCHLPQLGLLPCLLFPPLLFPPSSSLRLLPFPLLFPLFLSPSLLLLFQNQLLSLKFLFSLSLFANVFLFYFELLRASLLLK